MKKIKFPFFAFTLLALSLLYAMVNANAQNPRKFIKHDRNSIKDQYIVSLIDGVDLNDKNSAFSVLDDRNLIKPGQVKKIFTRAIQGFSIKMTEAEAERLSLDPRVEMVEQDVVGFLKGTQPNAKFGLDRVDQRNLPLDTTYNYNYDGTGVHVYVMDDGINGTLSEFGGRVTGGYDVFTGGVPDPMVCGGHGTRVAALIGSQTYGVAKNVMLHPVRVTNCLNGTASDFVTGVDWIIANKSGPSVINASLGYNSVNFQVDNATENAIGAGITFVNASGNEGQDGNALADACNQSPGRVPSNITVASSASNDTVDIYSSLGPCVDLFAPGEGTYTIAQNGAETTAVGTSFAAPFVAGAAALLLQQNPTAQPYEVRNALVANATPDVLTGDTKGAPNLLLYTFADFPPPELPVETTVWNAVAGFNTIRNPTKTWSYGYRDDDCGAYTGFPRYGTILFEGSPPAYLGFWALTSNISFPFVGKNLSSTTRTLGSIEAPPNRLVLYPGNLQRRAVLRWTVPSTATYTMEAHFKGISNAPISSSYRILYGSGEIAKGEINSNGIDIPFTYTFNLTGGKIIDFEVGNGINGFNTNDATGLDVTFTKLDTTALKPRARTLCY